MFFLVQAKDMSIRRTCPTLFYDDFSDWIIPGTAASPYEFFTTPDIRADDGRATVGRSGLQINSIPFKSTHNSIFDHPKYLVYQKNVYSIPESGELVYEARISVKQTGLDKLPNLLKATSGDSLVGVNNANSDIRVCSAGINAIDQNNLMVFDFILSNEDIYALYERLPLLRTEWGGPGPNYMSFTHVMSVGKRNQHDPLADFVNLSIAFGKQHVRWMIDGMEVFKTKRLGFPMERKNRVLEHSGPPMSVTMDSISLGFGTFSLMDMTNPQNPGQKSNSGLVDLTAGGRFPSSNPVVTNVDGTPSPPVYISQYPLLGADGTNFGQGASMNIKYIKVYLSK